MKSRSEFQGRRPKAKAASSCLAPRASSSGQGFTLLEVMIALVIIAVALVTLLGLSNRSIEVNQRLQRITQATLLAQQRISEIEVRPQGTPLQEEEGVFEPPFEEYRWRVRYDDSPLPNLKIVTVIVAWGEEAKNEMVDLASFVFQ